MLPEQPISHYLYSTDFHLKINLSSIIKGKMFYIYNDEQ